MLLIVSGAVEGVVDEGTGKGPHHIHPLGKCATAAWSAVTCPGNTASASAKTSERVPNICLLGPGSVLEAGLLHTGAENMEFRARSPVVLYRLTKYQDTGKGARLWHRF